MNAISRFLCLIGIALVGCKGSDSTPNPDAPLPGQVKMPANFKGPTPTKVDVEGMPGAVDRAGTKSK